jgi:hypothetical protein
MNEAQRLNYLEALGIQQWIAKAPLPNAKKSEFVEFYQVKQKPEENIPDERLENSQEKLVKVQMVSEEQEQQKQAVQQVREQKESLTLEVKEPNNHHLLKEENSLNKQEGALQISSSVSENPSCAFQIQGKRGQYLLFVELQDPQGTINAEEQNLVNNISKAIDSTFVNTTTRPIMPEQFKWPMFESHFKAKHLDQGENAAKEGIRAFLHSNIKKQHSPFVIVLGEQAQYFLGLNLDDRSQEGMVNLNALQNTQFILGASLFELSKQGNQSLKAELWKKILETIL